MPVEGDAVRPTDKTRTDLSESDFGLNAVGREDVKPTSVQINATSDEGCILYHDLKVIIYVSTN